MEDESRNCVTARIVVVEVEEEEVADENGEASGGLKSRSRKNRVNGMEGEIEGDAGVNGEVVGEHARSLYLDREQGITSLDETNGTWLEKVDQLVIDESMQNHETECQSQCSEDYPTIENHHHEGVKAENQPTSEEKCGIMLTGKVAVSKQVTVLNESKRMVEVDLERILEEQDTHDLYCPNCHSCITRRVILRKRKRTARENISDAKREKIVPVQTDPAADIPAAENTGESHDTEPDVFRCLSCLSFFIPTGTGFRLFKNFGKREEEDIQGSQQMPGRNQNWMSSLFELMKPKNKRSGLEDPLLGESHDRYGDQAENLRRKEEQITSDAPMSETILPGMPQSDVKVEELDAGQKKDTDEPRKGKDVHAVSFPNSPGQSKEHLPDEIKNDPPKEKEANAVSFPNSPGQSRDILPDAIKNASILSEQLAKNVSGSIGSKVEHIEKDSVKYVQNPPNQESFLFEKIKIDKAERFHVFKEGSEGDGNVFVLPKAIIKPIQEIYIEGSPRNDLGLTTPGAQSLPTGGETRIDLGEQTIAVARPTRQWDVLKAIVYGGLLESIASLGIVSSAAGSDVTTLNVIALGLANLVGGLLVMIHNLVELKNEQYKSIDKNEGADRYWELLGRRGYVRLHATVALISFILVGILPPIIYGFSFRTSDSKEYKLIAVAGASLLCIALLAIGKAHVQEGRKPYAKTLFYYIGLGVAASGLSYAVGMLIKELLQELGLFVDNTVAPTPPSASILEVISRVPSWQSY